MSGHDKGKPAGEGSCSSGKPTKISRSTKAGLVFSVRHISSLLKRTRRTSRVEKCAPVILAAAIEHISAEILRQAGNAAKQKAKKARKVENAKICIEDYHMKRAVLRTMTCPCCAVRLEALEGLLTKPVDRITDRKTRDKKTIHTRARPHLTC